MHGDIVVSYRMADNFEEHSTRALRNPEKHMSNPVNAFLAVKRFTSDWDHIVQTYIRNNFTEGMALLLQWQCNVKKEIRVTLSQKTARSPNSQKHVMLAQNADNVTKMMRKML